jgi:hypothetical protein
MKRPACTDRAPKRLEIVLVDPGESLLDQKVGVAIGATPTGHPRRPAALAAHRARSGSGARSPSARSHLRRRSFETWPIDRGSFRLIIAAQSWHWVAPEARFSKAAEALSDDGSLAVFGQVPVGLPTPLLDRFREIYLRQIKTWGPPPEAWYLPNGPFETWFAESGLFDQVEHRSYPWKWSHTTSSYVDFLRSRSDHRIIEPAKLDELLHEGLKRLTNMEGSSMSTMEPISISPAGRRRWRVSNRPRA